MNPEDLEIPRRLPVLPIKGGVVFPKTLAPIVVTTEHSKRLIDDVLAQKEDPKFLAAVTQLTDNPEPTPEELAPMGTAAIILRMLRAPDGTIRILLQGLKRIRLIKFHKEKPYLEADVEVVEEPEPDPRDVELEALRRGVINSFTEIAKLVPYIQEEQASFVATIEHPGHLADFIASAVNFKVEDRLKVLQTVDLRERLRALLAILDSELAILRLSKKIQQEVKDQIDKGQREFFLREQLKAIQRELGLEEGAEIRELKERLEKADLPPKAREAAERELRRLEFMNPASPEYAVARTYVEWLLDLPWSVETEDNLDIEHARRVLDEDHYDLEHVKRRILEFLAVRALKGGSIGTILCFVGPPGVGKTSLGKSIARALGRKFVRVSLGGVRDEAEIRGHRRTYVGAMPGRIIAALKQAGTKNPVFMLDEIDKLGSDFRGDPASALLEVLDPEQNKEFSDHYIEVPFDLSKVFFITTANTTLTIPPPLLDRMEVIELPGYIDEEKLHIAKGYLIPREKENTGLGDYDVVFPDKVIMRIIRDYTREAGVRELSRRINAVLRRVAVEVTRDKIKSKKVVITEKKLRKFLGPPVYYEELARAQGQVGVATGLAWTPYGGEVMFVEAAKVPGGKKLQITGRLGEVMKESCEIALTLVRARAQRLGVDPKFWEKSDIHIHVPSGAIPKDGPSAGVAIFSALVSLLTEKPLNPKIAMTGEVTLSGRVLPVGGIKEKLVAAKRAGVEVVLMPRWNVQRDLEEVPKEVKRRLRIVPVDTVDDVLENVLK